MNLYSQRIWRVALAAAMMLALNASLWSRDDKPKKDKEAPKEQKSVVIVKMRKDALLEIDGRRTKATGEERSFESPPLPPLAPGKVYYYTLVARWEPNNYTKITRTKKVEFKAGETVKVDMTVKDPGKNDDIVIRFVPTPPEVVDAMCKLAKVGKDDVVFDLGCGDGRLVITAVQKFGAKQGIGVDIDPKRIEESKANAKKAKVEDKVEFRKEDVFKVPDLEKATVILLYMSDELGEQLGPILQKRLKPGARIVSHRFLLGKWKPEKTETITLPETPTRPEDTYDIHLWKVEAKKEK